jgi:hypothetical protein
MTNRNEKYARRIGLWTAALRSGKYAQGVGHLAHLDEDGKVYYCCLGVACEVAIDNGLDLPVKTLYSDGMPIRGYNEQTSILPDAVADWYGFAKDPYNDTDPNNPAVHYVWDDGHEEDGVCLTSLNDEEGATFEQIANAISRTFLQ